MGMQIAKADERDMEVAMTIAGILCDVDRGYFPRQADGNCCEDDPDHFDSDKLEHLRAFHDRIMSAYDRAPGGMNRVVLGFHTVMHNDVVDPGKDHLALHPRIESALDITKDGEEELLP